VFTGPAYLTLYAFFNTKKAPLDNVLVRKALAYAMPYEDIITLALGGLGAVSKSYIPRGMYGHVDLEGYTFNVTKAEELLVQAGYERPDTGFRFKLVLTHLLDEPFETKMATMYKERLADLAIDLEVRPMPWVEQWGLATSDPAEAQDIFVMYWWPTYITPYDFLFSMFHSEDQPFFNLAYYSNPSFDALIDEAAVMEGVDRQQALSMYSEAQTILFDEVPAVPIFDRDNIYVYRSGIKGFVDNPAYPLVVFFYQLSV
jgi:peptide/nickel transport system substrate-binding protein